MTRDEFTAVRVGHRVWSELSYYAVMAVDTEDARLYLQRKDTDGRMVDRGWVSYRQVQIPKGGLQVYDLAIPRDPVPMAYWGKDHWSTLLYVETRCVDYRGVLGLPQMRTDQDRHPEYVTAQSFANTSFSEKKYPTILRDGLTLPDHDDWDCLEDLAAAGLLSIGGTGIAPVVTMLDAGWAIAAELREYRANGGKSAAFEPMMASA